MQSIARSTRFPRDPRPFPSRARSTEAAGMCAGELQPEGAGDGLTLELQGGQRGRFYKSL